MFITFAEKQRNDGKFKKSGIFRDELLKSQNRNPISGNAEEYHDEKGDLNDFLRNIFNSTPEFQFSVSILETELWFRLGCGEAHCNLIFA